VFERRGRSTNALGFIGRAKPELSDRGPHSQTCRDQASQNELGRFRKGRHGAASNPWNVQTRQQFFLSRRLLKIFRLSPVATDYDSSHGISNTAQCARELHIQPNLRRATRR
jgi:hypothetical protein